MTLNFLPDFIPLAHFTDAPDVPDTLTVKFIYNYFTNTCCSIRSMVL